jgi:hypothetical protein
LVFWGLDIKPPRLSTTIIRVSSRISLIVHFIISTTNFGAKDFTTDEKLNYKWDLGGTPVTFLKRSSTMTNFDRLR